MKPPKLYLSVHSRDGKNYKDEMKFPGYQRIALDESNWKSVNAYEGYNTIELNFGKSGRDINQRAKILALGTGTVVLMRVLIGDGVVAREITIHKDTELKLPVKAFHIKTPVQS